MRKLRETRTADIRRTRFPSNVFGLLIVGLGRGFLPIKLASGDTSRAANGVDYEETPACVMTDRDR